MCRTDWVPRSATSSCPRPRSRPCSIPPPRPSAGPIWLGDNSFTNRNTTFMTWNLLHLARMLKDAGGVQDLGLAVVACPGKG